MVLLHHKILGGEDTEMIPDIVGLAGGCPTRSSEPSLNVVGLITEPQPEHPLVQVRKQAQKDQGLAQGHTAFTGYRGSSD